MVLCKYCWCFSRGGRSPPAAEAQSVGRRQKVKTEPRLETDRLRLRPFVAEDAPVLAELAGAHEIADTMISIRHPFSISAARTTIAENVTGFQSGQSVHFAIESEGAAHLDGCVELRDIDAEHAQAERWPRWVLRFTPPRSICHSMLWSFFWL